MILSDEQYDDALQYYIDDCWADFCCSATLSELMADKGYDRTEDYTNVALDHLTDEFYNLPSDQQYEIYWEYCSATFDKKNR